MKQYNGHSKFWFLLVLLATFVAGCGSDDNRSQEERTVLTTYSLNGAIGTINESEKTIDVTLPFGTSLTTLVATFTTTGTVVELDAADQISGTTKNNFEAPVAYTVTASDGTTATYVVTAEVALNPAKAITSYSLNGVTGIVDEVTKVISIAMPFETDLAVPLVATFTATGEIVEINAVEQISAITENIFTADLEYTVTAADSTTSIYTVTVIIAPAAAKEIISYALNGVAGQIKELDKSITVMMPFGTNRTALVANFTTTGSGVKVGEIDQMSMVTVNNFTTDVEYTVVAADSTTALYTVTVTVNSAKGPATVNLGTAGNFVILAKSAVSTTGTTAVVGDIGVSPSAASYITGFSLIADSTNTFATSSLVTGKVYAADYATPTPANMTTAISDMEIAFTDAAGRSNPDFTELHAGDISGKILVPGLYKWGTGVMITSAGVTLEGGANDVWIFQIAQDLTVSNSAIVTLMGGAQAKNIFWQVSGQATLGTAADFKGILLSQTLISLNTGTKMNGRTLAQTAVTLNATAITAPVQ